MPDIASARNDLTLGAVPFTHRGEARGVTPSTAEIDMILALYEDYDAAGGQSGAHNNAADLSDALIDAVRHAYRKTYEGKALYHLRATLVDPNALCPVCGIGFCEELDHFLPKSNFGVFAIYARNLIPSCSDCNERKRAQAGDTPATQFVHAYFSELPHTVFLRADVRLEGAALNVSFGVDKDAGLPEALSERLSFQFDALALNERYRRELNLYLQSLSVGWWEVFDRAGVAGFRDYLNRQATLEANRLHLNHWRACLCRALAGHDAFCNGGFKAVYPEM
ncbi:MAG: HNH endonuclease signature motif containing protein [Maricaulis sp.]|uniref:HNH endonuclease signature motif containing protein n=1 Tax=Maricaulis sp. TaxID=1486257 RepID=UPI0026157A7F|nr:HNH endonuclease signature motif containing protein [Maricaulis sp.]MDM7983255.1 HNH endonuclease signature motif containing protein [Maricaulis sp.]